jgi:hypothetical protein
VGGGEGVAPIKTQVTKKHPTSGEGAANQNASIRLIIGLGGAHFVPIASFQLLRGPEPRCPIQVKLNWPRVFKNRVSDWVVGPTVLYIIGLNTRYMEKCIKLPSILAIVPVMIPTIYDSLQKNRLQIYSHPAPWYILTETRAQPENNWLFCDASSHTCYSRVN